MSEPADGSMILQPARALLDALRDRLALTDAGVPGRFGLVPGGPLVAFDNLLEDDCDGIGWVRVVQVFPSVAFPAPTSEPTRLSATPWALTLEAGVVRCAHSLSDEATPPTVEQLEQDAVLLQADGVALRSAVTCDLAVRWRDAVLGAWVPFDVQGGAMGSAVTVTVPLGGCGC